MGMSVFRLYPFFRNFQKKRNCFYSSLSNDSSRELLDYLIRSWGLRSGEATELCLKVPSRRHRVQKLERVVAFFRESGFADTQIRKALTMNPRLSTSKVEENLMPKMKAFQDWGLSAIQIAQMVATNPRFLNSSLEKNIHPIVAILKTVLPGDKNPAAAIKSLFSAIRGTPSVERLGMNLSNLRIRGVPDSSLSSLLVRCPTIFHLNPTSVERMVEKTHQCGFDYTSGMFPYALQAIGGMKESTWDTKLEVLRGFGWYQGNITTAFRKAPFFLAMSKTSLQKKLEFFMNELKLSPSQLAAAPTMLMYSLEKRVIPRVTVMRKLESSKLFNRNRSLIVILKLTEKQFYDEVVLKHKDKCPEVVQVYSSSQKSDHTES